MRARKRPSGGGGEGGSVGASPFLDEEGAASKKHKVCSRCTFVHANCMCVCKLHLLLSVLYMYNVGFVFAFKIWVTFLWAFYSSVESAMKLKFAPFCSP